MDLGLCLVCLGGDDKTPLAGWLKTIEVQISGLWRLEVEVMAPAWSGEGHLLGSRRLAVFHVAEGGKGGTWTSLRRALILFMRVCCHDLITSQSPHLLRTPNRLVFS